MNTFYENNYVYILFDQHRKPFYVGIGAVTKRCKLGYRIDQHNRDAKAYLNYGKIRRNEKNIQKLEVMKQILELGHTIIESNIVANSLTRQQANNMEINLIKLYGRRDLRNGLLVNKNNGGSGSTCPSQEIRDKISAANIGKIVSSETRRKQSEARKGRIISEEWRAKISKTNSGKPHSAEHNAKVGIATAKSWKDSAYRERMLSVSKKKWMVTYPDGSKNICNGLQDIVAAHTELRMPSLSQSGKKGKFYKGFLAEQIKE